jgi:predicted dehydrogenase
MPTRRRTQSKRSTSDRKVRYAVVGLGYISQIAVLPAFAHARENSELVALVSDDKTKLKKLARKYKVADAYTYETYADCLESKIVDAVYIALPNHMHRAYTEAAARVGVHVLCEKPMAPTEQDCEAMIAAADRGKVKLMIAYRLHFEEGNLTAIATVQRRPADLQFEFLPASGRRQFASEGRIQGWPSVRRRRLLHQRGP